MVGADLLKLDLLELDILWLGIGLGVYLDMRHWMHVPNISNIRFRTGDRERSSTPRRSHFSK